MCVSDLSLNDFRSCRSLVPSLEPDPSAFVDSNGQDKTNLVEAIVYLTTLSSHRIGADTALVRRTALRQVQPADAVVYARVVHGEKPSALEIETIVSKASRARLNWSGCWPRNLLGVLRAVVFAPEDFSLVRVEPGARRGSLNDLVVTLRPGLAGARTGHDKILARRASLLKSARATRSSISSMLSTLEIWDAQFAAAATRLITARVNVIRRLCSWVASVYETVSRISGQRSRAQLAYRLSLLTHEGHPESNPHDESAWLAGEETLLNKTALAVRLENAMGGLHAREIDRGANLVGAHHDNLSLFLAGLPACGFASHDEQWSLALALRLASYDMLRTNIGTYGGDGEPVLILDDVFASLDEQRRHALAQMIAGAQQVLLTAAVDDDAPAELSGARYRVTDGEVTRD